MLHVDNSIEIEPKPLVTIIIPTIGRPQYIIDALRSALAQDYKNIEILVSDNAPKVATAPLLAALEISDPRIKMRTRTLRLTAPIHLNMCISEAQGEYVIILSDDDQLSPGYISEMVALATQQSNISICFGRQKLINEHDFGIILADPPILPQQAFDGLEFLKAIDPSVVNSKLTTYISLFARKSDVLAVGGFKDYPDGSNTDNFVVFKLALRGRVAFGSEVMFYRVYQASSGLSTPFTALLAATETYTRDCAIILADHPNISHADRSFLNQKMKKGNYRMLLKRLRHIYRNQVSTIVLSRYFLKTLKFAITPIRIS